MTRAPQLLLFLLLALGGCGNMKESVRAAQEQVGAFHRAANGRDYQAILGMAAPEFTRATSPQDFRQFMSGVADRLGRVRRTQLEGWNVNFGSGGTLATLNYKTEFERGTGLEQFVFRTDGAQARLLGYHINSQDLLSAPPSDGARQADQRPVITAPREPQAAE